MTQQATINTHAQQWTHTIVGVCIRRCQQVLHRKESKLEDLPAVLTGKLNNKMNVRSKLRPFCVLLFCHPEAPLAQF